MYKIPKENWGAFLSQRDTMWCWAYALGGIFGLTKHEEIAKLHDTLGQREPDGTITDSASPEHVLKRAKEKGYIKDYKSINYAYKPRRIQAIIKALEKGIPLYMQKYDTASKTHEVRAIGFDEEKEQYLVIDSGKINYSPLSISYDVCESLFSVEIQPENYAKINADFKGETSIVEENMETEANDMKFIDVTKEDWFYDDVEDCFNDSIVNGKTDKLFAPNDNTTRAETCAIINRARAHTKAEILEEVREMIDKAIANAL